MRILVLCTGNSARSQMAEAWLRALDPSLEVVSAGTRPAAEVHWGAVQAMAACGIDIGGAKPKSVAEFLGQTFDYVITVCGNADQACPAFSGRVAARLHIPFDDPAAAAENALEEFRRVRDEIRARFARFYAEHAEIREAAMADLAAIAELLRGCSLPLDGLEEQFPRGYALTGAATGCAGVECYGEYGLLRSVAVAPALRGCGLGARLVENRVRWASGQGLRALYLLTTTAPEYFPRAGFVAVARATAPQEIRESLEFAQACPASALVMVRPL